MVFMLVFPLWFSSSVVSVVSMFLFFPFLLPVFLGFLVVSRLLFWGFAPRFFFFFLGGGNICIYIYILMFFCQARSC